MLGGTGTLVLGEVREVGMKLRHDDGPFSDGAAYALHRAAAHVADREDARNARLQWPGNGPPPRPDEIIEREIGPRLHEALGVQRDVAAPEPLGRGVRPDEEEHVVDVDLLLHTGAVVSPSDAVEASPLVGRE